MGALPLMADSRPRHVEAQLVALIYVPRHHHHPRGVGPLIPCGPARTGRILSGRRRGAAGSGVTGGACRQGDSLPVPSGSFLGEHDARSSPADRGADVGMLYVGAIIEDSAFHAWFENATTRAPSPLPDSSKPSSNS
jgi:hypothetical protein